MEPRHAYRKINLLPPQKAPAPEYFVLRIGGEVYATRILREERMKPMFSPTECRRMYVHTQRVDYLR